MLHLSRSRMSVSAASVAALLAFAAPAFALPPEVALTSPSGRQAVNPPAFAGTAGTMEWESREIAVDIWAGDHVGEKPLVVGNATLDRETGAFGGTLPEALPDGTYTARARQRNSEQETGYSAPLVFQIGAPPVEATTRRRRRCLRPHPSRSRPWPPRRRRRRWSRRSSTSARAAATSPSTSSARPARSWWSPRRSTAARCAAAIDRKEIRIRVDLRGEPKDTYTLRVAITRTRPDGKRIRTVAVEQIDYHTCIPTKKP